MQENHVDVEKRKETKLQNIFGRSFQKQVPIHRGSCGCGMGSLAVDKRPQVNIKIDIQIMISGNVGSLSCNYEII